MNAAGDFLYDIEMPPPGMPEWFWWLLAIAVLLALLLIALYAYRLSQPEYRALRELQQLQQQDPYLLAALLRDGMQHRYLPQVLPEAYLQELDLARYAVSPEVELPVLFSGGEKLLREQLSRLTVGELFKRLIQGIKRLSLQPYWQPPARYLHYVIADFVAWVRSWPGLLRRGNHE